MKNRLSQRMSCQHQPRVMNGIITQVMLVAESKKNWKMVIFQKKVSEPIYDVTRKIKQNWWGGTKLVSTTKAEQGKMKSEILIQNPKDTVLDFKSKRAKELEWIGHIEEFNALMDD